MLRNMYIIIIIIGFALVIVGFIGLSRQNSNSGSDRENRQDTIIATYPVYPDNSEACITQEASSPAKPSDTPAPAHTEASSNTPQSNKDKGNDFEGYVADCFSDKSTFTVLAWNQGVTSPNGVYAENNTDPDFHIKQRFNDKFDCEYYVEAKYHSRWSDNSTMSLNNYQLRRYRDFQREKRRKVLMAIGVGGSASNPAEFYVIPLDSVTDATLSSAMLAPYRLTNPHKDFRQYAFTYFRTKVFPASRSK